MRLVSLVPAFLAMTVAACGLRAPKDGGKPSEQVAASPETGKPNENPPAASGTLSDQLIDQLAADLTAAGFDAAKVNATAGELKAPAALQLAENGALAELAGRAFAAFTKVLGAAAAETIVASGDKFADKAPEPGTWTAAAIAKIAESLVALPTDVAAKFGLGLVGISAANRDAATGAAGATLARLALDGKGATSGPLSAAVAALSKAPEVAVAVASAALQQGVKSNDPTRIARLVVTSPRLFKVALASGPAVVAIASELAGVAVQNLDAAGASAALDDIKATAVAAGLGVTVVDQVVTEAGRSVLSQATAQQVPSVIDAVRGRLGDGTLILRLNSIVVADAAVNAAIAAALQNDVPSCAAATTAADSCLVGTGDCPERSGFVSRKEGTICRYTKVGSAADLPGLAQSANMSFVASNLGVDDAAVCGVDLGDGVGVPTLVADGGTTIKPEPTGETTTTDGTTTTTVGKAFALAGGANLGCFAPPAGAAPPNGQVPLQMCPSIQRAHPVMQQQCEPNALGITQLATVCGFTMEDYFRVGMNRARANTCRLALVAGGFIANNFAGAATFCNQIAVTNACVRLSCEAPLFAFAQANGVFNVGEAIRRATYFQCLRWFDGVFL